MATSLAYWDWVLLRSTAPRSDPARRRSRAGSGRYLRRRWRVPRRSSPTSSDARGPRGAGQADGASPRAMTRVRPADRGLRTCGSDQPSRDLQRVAKAPTALAQMDPHRGRAAAQDLTDLARGVSGAVVEDAGRSPVGRWRGERRGQIATGRGRRRWW